MQISYCSYRGTAFRLGYCSCLVRGERYFLFSKGHILPAPNLLLSDITFAFFIYKTNFPCCRNTTCKWGEINMHILHTHSLTVQLALTRRNCLEISAQLFESRVSANSGLNFNPGFLSFLSKALSRIIFSILFRVSNHQIVGKES